MTLLFISDLHLHPSRPDLTQAFYDFLSHRAQAATALYILGDFFDSWIGDDDDDPFALEVLGKLKDFTSSGKKLYLMHGNRDFLLGHKFAAQAGATLLEDPHLMEINGIKTVLLHGDSLCTNDTEYMALREEFRSKQWQDNILSQPLIARRALASQLRIQSATSTRLKAADILDVTTSAVIKLMRNLKVNLIIHGHTHRPNRHLLSLDGTRSERIVLGDWDKKGWCLSVSGSDINLESWDIEVDS